MKPLVIFLSLFYLSANVFAQIQFTVDAKITYQKIEGFGTSIYPIKTSPDNMLDLYQRSDFQSIYVDDLGASMCRIPIEADPIFPSLGEGQPPFSYDEILYTNQSWDMERNNTKYYLPLTSPRQYRWPPVLRDYSSSKAVNEWVSAIVAKNPDMKIIASCWSPPAWMKKKTVVTIYGDSIALPEGGGKLLPEYYSHYGKFLVEWVKAMKTIYNVDIYALSFQNEPLFVEPYESCVYSYDEYTVAFKAVVDEFVKAGIEMQFFGAEDMTKFPDRTKDYLKGIIDDPYYSKYLKAVATHGYTNGVITETDPSNDAAMWEFAHQYNKQYWMTESGTGLMSWDDTSEGKGALNQLAAGIHNILVHGNSSLISFWQVASKDSNKASVHELMAYDKHTKKSHIFRHFSKNIRPGAVRVDVSPNDSEDVVQSAYYDSENGKLIIELINFNFDDKPVKIALKNFTGNTFEVIRSSRDEDYTQLDNISSSNDTLTLTMKERSIVTLSSSGPVSSASNVSTPQNDVRVYPNPSTGIFNVVSNDNSITEIRILSVQGQLIYSKKNPERHEIVDLSDFEDGVYIIQSRKENGLESYKIIKN